MPRRPSCNASADPAARVPREPSRDGYTPRMQLRTLSLLGALFVYAATSLGAAETPLWSRFRGPNGSGVSAASSIPIEFGTVEESRVAATVAAGTFVSDSVR